MLGTEDPVEEAVFMVKRFVLYWSATLKAEEEVVAMLSLPTKFNKLTVLENVKFAFPPNAEESLNCTCVLDPPGTPPPPPTHVPAIAKHPAVRLMPPVE